MAEPEPELWFILGRRVAVMQVPDDANALDDPNLLLKLRLDRPPPRITPVTALTSIARGQLSIVATSNKDLLLHEHGRPSEPNTPDIFFLADYIMPDARTAASLFDVFGTRLLNRTAASVFDVFGTRLLDRLPGLPDFSDVRNVGLLRGAHGTHVVAELQATNLIYLNWPVIDDAANPQWTTHDVIAHGEKLWWVNLSRGLVACDPDPVDNLQPMLEFVALPVLAGFEVRHEPRAHIDRYRVVGVSAGEMRFVDVARRRNDPEGETRVVVWTLDLPLLIINARWRNNPWETTLADIWNNAAANYPQMPRGVVPVVALVHPNEPAV